MGGRGASSASSRGGGGAVAGMSDERLASELKTVKADMERVGDVMARSAPGHTGYIQGTPWGSKAEHETYQEAFRKYGVLRARRDEILDEKAKRTKEKAVSAPKRTFVNSFGEATTRYITTSSYERAQKRLNKEVQSRMSGWR